MASFVVSPVITRILHACASLIHHKQSPLFPNYKEELENISRSLTSIQHVVTNAEENQHEEETLKHWLSRLTEAAYDAEHELDTIATEFQLMIGSGVPQIDFSGIHNISHRIEKIAEEKQRLELLFTVESRISRLQGVLGTNYPVDTGVFGREKDKEEIVDRLLCEKPETFDKTVDVIGINGAGVGKTTLAHLVLNDERVKSCFQPHIIWVSLAQGCTLPGILQGIRGFQSNNPCPESEYSSIEPGFKDFVSGKRFLIVLDNLSFKDKQAQIFLLQLLELGIKGSKLLYTSRSPLDIDGETSFRLKPLPTDKFWILFRTIAFEGGKSSSSELEEIGEAIVDKCRGSPLSAKVLASLLQGNTNLQDWRTIKESTMWKLDMPALQIAYHNLPCHLKEILMSCSSFPKDYVFNKRELAKIWMAQGLIPMGEEDDAEEIGMKYFEELLTRCFFQPFEIGSDNGVKYTMHDVIYDFVHLGSGFLKNRHLLEMIDERHPWYVREEVFFQQNASRLKFLRVLDLSWSEVCYMPGSIEECKLLRYLDVSTSDSLLPDSVCNLCNLQTLRILGVVFFECLPKDLYKLSKLRHLEFDKPYWPNFYSWPAKLGKLTGLRTLSAYKVGVGSGYGIKELKNMEHLTGSLHIGCLENAVDAKEANLKGKKRLQKLDLEWSEKIKNKEYNEDSYLRILEDLSPNENILELEIGNYRSNQFPDWMTYGVVLKKLEVLTLNNCTRLKVLDLDLPSLRKLSLKGMEELEEISKLECPVLKELEMVGCRAIHSFPKDGVPASVELIKIKRCWKLYERCQKETGPEWPKIAHISRHQIHRC